MSKDIEPGIATGIHLVATATLCSKGASRAEIDLAGEVLKRAPKRSLPRELAGSIETFNRHMDAAIESCNDSDGEPTRAGRRARLASDLERAGLVLIDSGTLAELLDRQLAGDVDGEDLGAELLDSSADADEPRDYQPSSTFSAEAPIGEDA